MPSRLGLRLLAALGVTVTRRMRFVLPAVLAAVSLAAWTSSPAEPRQRVAGAGTAAADDTLPDFVEIPGGPFIMGADQAHDPQAFENERWSRTEGTGTVALPRFHISRHEITGAQFAAFVRATGATVDPRAMAGPPNHPVTFVSWPDAIVYCRWLTKTLTQSSATPAPLRELLSQGARVTLPTEAEWEKAARGTDGRIYPWGSTPRPARANFKGTGTTPVGQFGCPECPYGLADMSGNVWEWTRSPYQPYPYDASDDRASLGDDALWVIRGGGYGEDARLIRTTARTGADPGARRPFIGFRVALSPAPR